jgi:hypothetical protein
LTVLTRALDLIVLAWETKCTVGRYTETDILVPSHPFALSVSSTDRFFLVFWGKAGLCRVFGPFPTTIED